ncbi:MAG: lipoyltransferase [Paramuribaculum sp.]|nr:lipoyltransferase [Paramuribaculum sp.]
MRYVELPYSSQVRELPFYLAMEEYLAAGTLADGSAISSDCFFMWQVEPTVIFGRNQDAYAEVDMEYCRAHGIRFYRRKSGGGCVYADMDNVMMSYITHTSTPVADTFSRYTSMVAEALRSLGLDATASGRNDIEVAGMKVSGNAFYHTTRASIVHGTMLIDTDMAHMARAITPSRAKLRANGVASVPSRITTLRRHTDITIPRFLSYMKRTLCKGPTLLLSEADIIEIERIARSYYSDDWIFGRRSQRPSVERRSRIEGAGQFHVQLNIDTDNRIEYVNLGGDFFLLADLDSMLLRPLAGVDYSRDAIGSALEGVDTAGVIRGLQTNDFINLIIP